MKSREQPFITAMALFIALHQSPWPGVPEIIDLILWLINHCHKSSAEKLNESCWKKGALYIHKMAVQEGGGLEGGGGGSDSLECL